MHLLRALLLARGIEVLEEGLGLRRAWEWQRRQCRWGHTQGAPQVKCTAWEGGKEEGKGREAW